jgi:uncharacterized membrane protein
MKLAQLPQQAQTDLQQLGTAGGFNVSRSPEEWAGILINAFLSVLGVVFLILALYGGFIWMKAKGNEKEVERAKDVLTNAIIGIIIVFVAYAISRFLIGVLTQ